VALERHEEAFTHATEAVRLDAADWRNYVEQARALIGMPDHINDARSAAQTAVQLAPREVSTHLVAGQVELADGQIEQAAEAFRRVLSIDPSNSAAFNELARMQLRGAPAKPAATSGARRMRLLRRR
jgi:Tfp pilus assembly protein PilF